MIPAPLLPPAALACLLPDDSTPPAGRSSSPLRHADQIGPLWPALEVWRFLISTAPVTPLGPAPASPPPPRPEVRMVPPPTPKLNLRSPSHHGLYLVLGPGSPPYLASLTRGPKLIFQHSFISSPCILPTPPPHFPLGLESKNPAFKRTFPSDMLCNLEEAITSFQPSVFPSIQWRKISSSMPYNPDLGIINGPEKRASQKRFQMRSATFSFTAAYDVVHCRFSF